MSTTAWSKVAILGGAARGFRGGSALRWTALRDATSLHRPSPMLMVGCDRTATCARWCRENGRSTERPAAWHWTFQTGFCAAHAARLAQQLHQRQVSHVVCSGLDVYGYVPQLARHGHTVILDMHNVELDLQRCIHEQVPDTSSDRLYYRDEALRAIAAAERSAIDAAEEVWVCSDVDEAAVRRHYPSVGPTPIRVVPNVVDVPADRPAAPRQPTYVSYTGRLDYFPNVAAAMELMTRLVPAIREHGCQLPVHVAGASPHRELVETAAATGVRLTANPATMRDIIAGSIMVVPLRIGGGSRLKILEAFAQGAIVISTAKGIEGIDAEPGIHYLPAETAHEFARAVHSVNVNPQLRAFLLTKAWQLVSERYSIESLRRRVRAMCGAQ